MLPIDSVESFLNQQIFGGGGNVKSVQQQVGFAQLTSGNATLNVTFDAVDENITIPFVMSYPQTKTTAPNNYFVTAELTSSTNVLLTRTSTTDTANCMIHLLELQGLKSFQKGTATLSAGALLITINEVNRDKTKVFFNYRPADGNLGFYYRLTDSVTLRLDQSANPSASTKTINYYIAEFN